MEYVAHEDNNNKLIIQRGRNIQWTGGPNYIMAGKARKQ